MNPPLPSLTSVWHNAPYAAISPERPELSALGKTVIITGAVCGFFNDNMTLGPSASAYLSNLKIITKHS
jgi:hypothetical protein